MKIILVFQFLCFLQIFNSSHLKNVKFSKKILTEYEKPDRELVNEFNLDDHQCNQEFLLNYGIQGNQKPDIKVHKYCPGIGLNCCTAEDIDHSLKIFNNSKKNIERYYETYLYSLKYLLGFSSEIKFLSENLKEHTNPICKNYAEKFISSNFDNLQAEMVFEILNKSIKEVSNLRKGFYCILCDGVNHHYVSDFKGNNLFDSKNTLVYDYKFCNILVEKTFKASFLMKKQVKDYLKNMAIIVSCSIKEGENITKVDEKIENLYEYHLNNENSIDQCDLAKKKENFEFIAGCKDYCSSLNPAHPSPLLDGDIKEIEKYFELISKHRNTVFENSDFNSLTTDVLFTEDVLKFNYNMMKKEDSVTFFKSSLNENYLDKFEISIGFEQGKGINAFRSVEGNNYNLIVAYNKGLIYFASFIYCVSILFLN